MRTPWTGDRAGGPGGPQAGSRLGGVLSLLAVMALASCAGGEDPAPEVDPFSAVRQEPAAGQSAQRAAPRFEEVATFAGSGPARRPFAIAGGAIQWRARYRCASGRLALSLVPPTGGTSPGGRRTPLDQSECPRGGTGSGIRTGPMTLDVEASGPWRVTIEQQVETPLEEPPLPAMASPDARVLARGRFYAIERGGRGTASVYRLPGGRLALRLERFGTSANTGLFVWLSRAERPTTTRSAFTASHSTLAKLKSTAGDQNYLLPRGTDADEVRSVVIWCAPVRIAYTAATLRRRGS